MSRIFFTSDTHFNHMNIVPYCMRPFYSLEHMNQSIIENFNSVLEDDDYLIHLGDVGLGPKDQMHRFMPKIKCHKILVAGNHDRGTEFMKTLGFEQVVKQAYIYHEGVVFWCAHIPSDNSEDSRSYVRPKAEQPYNIKLCGHVHTAWRHSKSGDINVGVDMWGFRPIPSEELVEYAKKHGLYQETPLISAPGSE